MILWNESNEHYLVQTGKMYPNNTETVVFFWTHHHNIRNSIHMQAQCQFQLTPDWQVQIAKHAWRFQTGSRPVCHSTGTSLSLLSLYCYSCPDRCRHQTSPVGCLTGGNNGHQYRKARSSSESWSPGETTPPLWFCTLNKTKNFSSLIFFYFKICDKFVKSA